MKYYAIIKNVGYECVEAQDECHAQRMITVRMLEKGAKGLWRRWKAHGAQVARFIRQSPDREFARR